MRSGRAKRTGGRPRLTMGGKTGRYGCRCGCGSRSELEVNNSRQVGQAGSFGGSLETSWTAAVDKL